MSEIAKIAKSWKAWGVFLGTAVAFLVFLERAQPYAEAYNTKALRKEVMALKVQVYDLKSDMTKRFDRMEVMWAEAEAELDKDLIKATIEAVEARRRAGIARTP